MSLVIRASEPPPGPDRVKYLGDNCNSKGDNVAYYALNKILNSDWLNTNLTLVDVWLEGSNVR